MLSRFGPAVARSAFFGSYPRHMATASSASDPVQKLFVDKIKEFKSTNKGLDEAHQKAMVEEMARLKRVYQIEDESKLAQFDYKFSNEHNVSLRDLDETKELRNQIATGEYQKQLTQAEPKTSALLASVPEQVTLDLHLPPLNKPDLDILNANIGAPRPPQIAGEIADYEFVGNKMTPDLLERTLNVRFGKEMPTIHDDKAPERDIVNFPRQPVIVDAPPTRYHFIPESWFKFFYPKTGVTGPYAFAGAFTTFLLSKEWLVYEHELLTGCTTTVIFTYAVIKYGPTVSNWMRKNLQNNLDDWEHWRTGHINVLTEMENHYKHELTKKDLLDELYQIRKQDVDMQLESEYRTRLKTVYDDTRRKLNYLVSKADSERQIAYKNMVNWVTTNAVASIGAKQESEVLDNCIVSLKQLASKNANAI